MNITINGKQEQVEGSLSVARLLTIKKVESPEMVSVQLNGAIVDRTNYEQTIISDSDEIDFLYFMGGGGGERSQ